MRSRSCDFGSMRAILGVLLVSAFSLLGLQQKASIRIVSPSDGVVAKWDSTIVVKVSTTPAVFNSVVIGGEPVDLIKLVQPPYEHSFRIPRDVTPRIYYISAIGVTEAGESVGAEISIDVERPDQPVQLHCDLRQLILNPTTSPARFGVYGTFADGSRTDLTDSPRTKYKSDHSNVASVKDGEVTAVARGQARITITHGPASVVIPVTVESAPPRPKKEQVSRK